MTDKLRLEVIVILFPLTLFQVLLPTELFLCSIAALEQVSGPIKSFLFFNFDYSCSLLVVYGYALLQLVQQNIMNLTQYNC